MCWSAWRWGPRGRWRCGGTVTDEGTHAPVAGADVLVQVDTRRVAAVTDEAGHFVVDVPEGVWALEVLSLDHAPWSGELTVTDPPSPIELVLERGDFEEITVLFYKDPDPVVTRRSVTAGEVARVPGAFGDPVRVVTSLPGAARPPFGSSQLIIRGGNDDDTTVFIDGVEVPIVYHLGGYRSVVHPSMVAEVDFLPGVFPARYGDTTAGLVDVQTRADWPPGVGVDRPRRRPRCVAVHARHHRRGSASPVRFGARTSTGSSPASPTASSCRAGSTTRCRRRR